MKSNYNKNENQAYNRQILVNPSKSFLLISLYAVHEPSTLLEQSIIAQQVRVCEFLHSDELSAVADTITVEFFLMYLDASETARLYLTLGA